jgi:hypothetical protein
MAVHVRLTPGIAATSLMVLAACVPDGQWFTPAGAPLGKIDCSSPAPLSAPAGREICLGRLIPETPEEIARCEKEGGTTGPLSVVNKRFACLYPKTGRTE